MADRVRRSYHVAISVDVDRFTDAQLRRKWLPVIRLNGRTPSIEELRIACHNARMEGKHVFPPCNNVDERGHCQGHGDG